MPAPLGRARELARCGVEERSPPAGPSRDAAHSELLELRGVEVSPACGRPALGRLESGGQTAQARRRDVEQEPGSPWMTRSSATPRRTRSVPRVIRHPSGPATEWPTAPQAAARSARGLGVDLAQECRRGCSSKPSTAVCVARSPTSGNCAKDLVGSVAGAARRPVRAVPSATGESGSTDGHALHCGEVTATARRYPHRVGEGRCHRTAVRCPVSTRCPSAADGAAGGAQEERTGPTMRMIPMVVRIEMLASHPIEDRG